MDFGLWEQPITEEKGLYAALLTIVHLYQHQQSKKITAKPFCFLMDASMLGVELDLILKGAGEIIVKGVDKDR